MKSEDLWDVWYLRILEVCIPIPAAARYSCKVSHDLVAQDLTQEEANVLCILANRSESVTTHQDDAVDALLQWDYFRREK